MKIQFYLLFILFTLLNSFHLSAIETDSLTRSLFDRSIEELIEQEVTIATKSTQKLSQTPSVVSVITAEEIKAMGFRSLEDVLETIPGFAISQTRQGAKVFGIRGVSNIRQGGRLLVLMDGTPYNGIMYGSSIFFGSTFNMDAVERIEVIRGPGSALYGRNAFSGVVNIITKKANKSEIEIGTSIGDFKVLPYDNKFSTHDAKAAMALYKSEFNFRIDAKYLKSDDTDSKYNNGEGGESIWNLSHDNIYFNGNAKYKNFQFFGSFYQRIDGICTGTQYGDFVTNGSTEFHVGTYSLLYSKDISSKTSINVKLYGRNEYRFMDFELTTPRTTDTFNLARRPFNEIYPQGAYAEPVFNAYTYGVEVEMSFQLIKNNRLLTGIQGDLHGVKNATVRSNYDLATSQPLPSREDQYSKETMPLYAPGWIRNNGHAYKNGAIYVQDVHYFMRNLSATFGGRLDIDSEVGISFNPRIAIVWEPNNIISLKQLFGMAYRAPTTNEQYKIMGADRGNEELRDERITTFEPLVIGLKFKKIYIQASTYINFLDNLILQLFTDSTNTVRSYYNSGMNTSYGFELEAKYFINKRIYTFANYSFTKSDDSRDLDGEIITTPHSNISKHIFNVGVNSKISHLINWSVLFRYIGPLQKFPTNDPSALEYVSQDRVGDYYMLNSTLVFSNIFKGFDISLQGYNLLNSTYFYQDDTFAYQPPQSSRHFLLRASYKFDL